MPLLSILMSAASWVLWFSLYAIAFGLVVNFFLLPGYTYLLASITISRAKWRRRHEGKNGDGGETSSTLSPWSGINTSLFQGRVSHTRHQPKVHAFGYPLTFAVVDLHDASELFGGENVTPSQPSGQEKTNERGDLWPLSSLMLLRDEDHLKNGEGLPTKTDPEEVQNISLRERLSNLVCERTNGKLDLRATKGNERSQILLVTHLMYYYYCFNPVSFYFILKPKTETSNEGEEVIEAVVVEISNTPWNEMSTYVLHPDSVDTFQHDVVTSGPEFKSKTYQYSMHKTFHVSPFMTMDHDYDWEFNVSKDRIKVGIQMMKHPPKADDTAKDDCNKQKPQGQKYFTASFDIKRTLQTTTTFPFQLAKVINKFPMYCLTIQFWIHVEALRLLMKGVTFVPHPDGSETGASKLIASVMRPVFAGMALMDAWWKSRKKLKDE